MKIAQRLSKVLPSVTLALTQKAKELRAQGIDVIALTAGEPDFAPPEAALEAFGNAAKQGHTRYTAVPGTVELRRAIRERHLKDGLDYPIEQIVVSTGAKQALFNALLALLDPGDEVIIPAPFWVSYPDMTRIADGVPVTVATDEADGFTLKAKDLEAAITEKTRVFILNSPSNPTGGVYTEAQLRALADVLLAHPNITVISDEIYDRLLYDGAKHLSIFQVEPKLMERGLLVNGVSKSYAMTGLRIGWALGPVALIKAMSKLQGQSTSNPNAPAQEAARVALEGDQSFVDTMLKAFTARRKMVVDRLNAIPGVHCFAPLGAFYVMPNLAGVMGKTMLNGQKIEGDTTAFAQDMVERHALVTVPGAPFGANTHLRLSFATDEATLEKGLDRLEKAIRELKD